MHPPHNHPREGLESILSHYHLTFQESRQLREIARDLEMWRQPGVSRFFPVDNETPIDRSVKKRAMRAVTDHWQALKQEHNRYPDSEIVGFKVHAKAQTREKSKLGLGYCPVASPKTRCCNLLTLDAVENCGYACSYCSIQSFYPENQVFFDPDFTEKLETLEIDPEQTYHIGTGQSSDSLMWGNSHGILDALISFAEKHPNVILELKTKSANIKHLIERDFPRNILCTWSLNTQTIIDHEERGSASLEQRIQAARRIADKGRLVGFHFHPIIHYDTWQKDYADLVLTLKHNFYPGKIALISLGTLTYIKPVIRQIRERGGQTQILKMPLEEAEGKLSYPEPLKLDLFKHLYDCFPSEWRQQIFFYLCMEHQRFWEPVFGYKYHSNQAFETAMKSHYLEKIRTLHD